MKRRYVFSYYRATIFIAWFCLMFPCVGVLFRFGGSSFPAALSAGLLSGSAVLLLLPIVEERSNRSFWFALGAACVCVCGVLLCGPERLWLCGVLLVHFAGLLLRSLEYYVQLRPLFRHFAVWFNIENHARSVYSLGLYLLAVAQPCTAPRWVLWLLVALDGALFGVLLVRVFSGRTLFVSFKRELAIKELIKGNLRTVPPQAGVQTEDVARMTRVYERVMTQMEQKHLFLDEDFSLNDLAAAVYTNKSYLSKTINIVSGRNFSQFVNFHRVHYSIELMHKDPHLKVISLAMMSGFHSSVSYNMAFKLNMGETPSAYLERLRKEKGII